MLKILSMVNKEGLIGIKKVKYPDGEGIYVPSPEKAAEILLEKYKNGEIDDKFVDDLTSWLPTFTEALKNFDRYYTEQEKKEKFDLITSRLKSYVAEYKQKLFGNITEKEEEEFLIKVFQEGYVATVPEFWQQLYLLVEEANIPELLRKLQRNFVYGEANSIFLRSLWKHPEMTEELKDRLKLVIWGFYLNEIGLALKQYLRIRRELNLDEIERLSEKELLKMVLEKIERLSQKVEDENSKTREHIEINREEVIRKMAEREQRMQKFLEEMAEELTAVVQKLSSSNSGRVVPTTTTTNTYYFYFSIF
jgi:hypothetical protein